MNRIIGGAASIQLRTVANRSAELIIRNRARRTGAAIDRQEWTEAIRWFERSLRMKEALSDVYGMALTYGELGAMYLTKGEPDNAEHWLFKSLESWARARRLERALALSPSASAV